MTTDEDVLVALAAVGPGTANRFALIAELQRLKRISELEARQAVLDAIDRGTLTLSSDGQCRRGPTAAATK